MKRVFYYETLIGKLGIAEEYGFITNVYYMCMKQPLNAKQIETDVLKEANVQLNEYFLGQRKDFDLPLNPSGTDFQQTVWSELLTVPYGELRTYKDVAKSISAENAVRAVGNACNKNPIPIIIPCHRIIASDGKISGYIGGAEVKQKLLEIESPKED
ncbi:MAG: methylated-DNA--[protein]-cysteine S-methyltransferase [Cyanobacteria bacterium RUI128]|nr:methylated-DNA--[protein]-cysteine S-methyltransferase [Cyanobacteria bacterium RUI128]